MALALKRGARRGAETSTPNPFLYLHSQAAPALAYLTSGAPRCLPASAAYPLMPPGSDSLIKPKTGQVSLLGLQVEFEGLHQARRLSGLQPHYLPTKSVIQSQLWGE